MKKDNVVTLTKISEKHDSRKYYYTVDNYGFKSFFYDLVKAENYIKSLNKKYEYKEIEIDWILD